MKLTKADLLYIRDKHYNSLIATCGLKNAIWVVRGITKLLKNEKKRRKGIK